MLVKSLGMPVKCDSDKDENEQDYLQLEDEETADDEAIENDVKEVMQETYCPEECDDIQKEIHQLKEIKLINNSLHSKLDRVNNMLLSRIKTDTIPIFKQNSDKSQQLTSKHPIFEIEYGGEKRFIHKTTAVWLFQERVYITRLLD